MTAAECGRLPAASSARLFRLAASCEPRHGFRSDCEHRHLRHRLRPPRPRAPACALGRDPRRRAMVGRAAHAAPSRRPGPPGTACRRVATSSWTGAALAALEFFELRGQTVLCPSNTFMATPLAIAGARARRSSSSTATATTSACRSTTSSARRASTSRAPSILVHIGGHIAFEVERIAAFCRERGDRPARGLRARARRLLARPARRHVGRRGHLVVRRDEDDLDRRGRDARLPAPGADRVRAHVPQLRQAGLRRSPASTTA